MRMNRIAWAAAPLLILACSLPVLADDSAPASAAAPTTCKDGTTSTATGRGACSSHGGVQKTSSSSAPAAASPAAATPPAATPKSAPAASSAAPPAAKSAGNTDPTGATAKCKDGTYSKSKSHSGACSHHGGVDQWLNASQ
jgi:Protein of unknown function (DUF3761)